MKLVHLALLLTDPGNQTIGREVVEENVCRSLIGGTLEPSWFGLRFPQRGPRTYVRIVVQTYRENGMLTIRNIHLGEQHCARHTIRHQCEGSGGGAWVKEATIQCQRV